MRISDLCRFEDFRIKTIHKENPVVVIFFKEHHIEPNENFIFVDWEARETFFFCNPTKFNIRIILKCSTAYSLT